MTSTTTGNAASQVRVVVRPPYPHPSPPNGRGAPTSSWLHGRRRRRIIVDLHLLELNGLSVAKGAPAHLLQHLARRLGDDAGAKREDDAIVLQGEPVVALLLSPPYLSRAGDGLPRILLQPANHPLPPYTVDLPTLAYFLA